MLRFRPALIAFGLIAAGSALGGCATVMAAPDSPAARQALNARVFDTVWSETRRRYYDPGLHGLDWDASRQTYRPRALEADDADELYAVLRDMLGELKDQHANAQSPASVINRELTRTRRAVLGLLMTPEDDGVWKIEDIREGSVADEARLERGWRLMALDGESWRPDLILTDGVPVVLTLRDETGGVRDLTLTPRLMDPVPLFTTSWLDHDTAVLRIEAFEPGLGDWLGATLAQLPPETDLVLDLRGNPGGRLAEAEAVLSCFLPRGQAWAVQRFRGREPEVMHVDGDCGDRHTPFDNDLVVLVGPGSRSAAELTPAALQEAGRAVVIGEQTPGVVLISQEFRLPDGGKLSLRRADFLTHGGHRLEGNGVTPDILAPTSLDQRRAGVDPGLDAAIEALRMSAVAGTQVTRR